MAEDQEVPAIEISEEKSADQAENVDVISEVLPQGQSEGEDQEMAVVEQADKSSEDNSSGPAEHVEAPSLENKSEMVLSPVNEEMTETANENNPEVTSETADLKDASITDGKEQVVEEIPVATAENEEEPEQEHGPLLDQVTQPLSREGSVILEVEQPAAATEVPDPSGTPPPAVVVEGQGIDNDYAPKVVNILSSEIESIASSAEVPVYNRTELIERYQQAVEERSALQSLNSQLQHKLAEYFKKKKTDERQQEIEKNVSDQEQRYIKYLANLDELQAEQSREQESYKEQIEELKERCFEKQNRVKEAREEFMKHKFEIAKQALNSRSGRSIPIKDVEQYQQLEQKKDHEVMLVRLENIKLKNRLKKREMQLKAKEELAEGLHLIDFEQLKIENQTYNEKIEERNEELLKLRKKITTTVQVLTHLKEKLQFVQAERVKLKPR